MGLFDHLQTSLGPYTQGTRLLRLHTPMGADVLVAERVRIREEVGPQPEGTSGFRIELQVQCSDTHVELKKLLGQPGLLELLTQQSRTDLRCWHGHITEARLLGSDGGLARYLLVIEPWLAFLNQRRDSWVFQGQTVMEIFEEVFADYAGQGRLVPAWRWDLADPGVYPQRSLCTQYAETDLGFLRRLALEEGFLLWWEHEGDAGSPNLGKHTLVIGDHNGAFASNPQARVRYTQTGMQLPEDSLMRWSRTRRVRTGSVSLASPDYRSLSLRGREQLGAESRTPELAQHDVPGLYASESAVQAERHSRVQIEAFDALREQVTARGSWRTAAPATRFTLLDHTVHDGSDSARDEFIALVVEHRARSNVGADEAANLGHILGGLASEASTGGERSQGAAGANASDEPLYECRITAQPARLPVRMAGVDEHGNPDSRIHPRPTIHGAQTALVVGLGEPVHTDRDHRIKVQFHWQRGRNASHRLDHPGGANAPASDAAGTWVRVAESVAGNNWGSNFTPRLGQEVLVGFIGGDIDRPVVTGVVYNGRGQLDAQGNQVIAGAAGAIGSADAWFPGAKAEGKLQAHQHPQVHTGYKSQELVTSQGGFGGHNQLVFDDSPGEGRIELYSSSAQTRLQLGHLLHQVDNKRLQHRGHGADLASAAWGAVRAGSGGLFSAHARPASTQASQQIDPREPLNQLDAGQQLIHTLAESAQKHNAKSATEPSVIGAKRADTGKQLPAEKGMFASLASLETTDTRGGIEGDEEHIGGGNGTVPAWGRPDLVTAAPAGIGSFTPASTLMTASTNVTLAAGQDIQQIAQANHATAVKDAAILFTYGVAKNGAKPNKETGIHLHAASGNVQTQSQTGATRIAADKRVHAVSTTGKVTIAAPKHVMLAAAGAAIIMEGGEITCKGPGSVLYKASLKIFNSGGANVPYAFKQLPNGSPLTPKPGTLDLYHRYVDIGGTPLEGVSIGEWRVIDAKDAEHKGKLDAKGFATVSGLPAGLAQVFFGPDPRDPWDEPSYYVPYEWKPKVAEAAAKSRSVDAPERSAVVDEAAPDEQAEQSQLPQATGASPLLTPAGVDLGKPALPLSSGVSGAAPMNLAAMPAVPSLPSLPALPSLPNTAVLPEAMQPPTLIESKA